MTDRSDDERCRQSGAIRQMMEKSDAKADHDGWRCCMLAVRWRWRRTTAPELRRESATCRPMPRAPVGHRQPRADQVPSEKNLSDPNDPVNREDAALDRKIKSICRGC